MKSAAVFGLDGFVLKVRFWPTSGTQLYISEVCVAFFVLSILPSSNSTFAVCMVPLLDFRSSLSAAPWTLSAGGLEALPHVIASAVASGILSHCCWRSWIGGIISWFNCELGCVSVFSTKHVPPYCFESGDYRKRSAGYQVEQSNKQSYRKWHMNIVSAQSLKCYILWFALLDEIPHSGCKNNFVTDLYHAYSFYSSLSKEQSLPSQCTIKMRADRSSVTHWGCVQIQDLPVSFFPNSNNFLFLFFKEFAEDFWMMQWLLKPAKE